MLYGIGSIEPGHVGYGFRVNMTPRAHHQTGKLESRLYRVSSAYLRDADLTVHLSVISEKFNDGRP